MNTQQTFKPAPNREYVVVAVDQGTGSVGVELEVDGVWVQVANVTADGYVRVFVLGSEFRVTPVGDATYRVIGIQ